MINFILFLQTNWVFPCVCGFRMLLSLHLFTFKYRQVFLFRLQWVESLFIVERSACLRHTLNFLPLSVMPSQLCFHENVCNKTWDEFCVIGTYQSISSLTYKHDFFYHTVFIFQSNMKLLDIIMLCSLVRAGTSLQISFILSFAELWFTYLYHTLFMETFICILIIIKNSSLLFYCSVITQIFAGGGGL